MLTRVRNAQKAKRSVSKCRRPSKRFDIATVLKDEGYISDYKVSEDSSPTS